MKMVLMNIDKFVLANHLQEVTDPILVGRGFKPTPEGILSTDIFGMDTHSRKTTFAYINLNCHLMQPLAYKTAIRIDRQIADIIAGTKNFAIDKSGYLVEDTEKGNTGSEWLYKVWDKIKFKESNSSTRKKRIKFLKSHTRDEIFQSKELVCPPFYRDINIQSTNKKKPSIHVVNSLYCRLIRLSNLLNQGMFTFSLHQSRAQMQETLVEIYDHFKGRCEKKRGLIRQQLLGKSVDYGARLVISATKFDANKPSEMVVDFEHTGVPLSHCVSLFSPFFIGWIKNFLYHEFESTGMKYPMYDSKSKEIKYIEIKDPLLQFSDNKISEMMDTFVHSQPHRFDPIYVETLDKKYPKIKIRFKGYELGKSDENMIREIETRGSRDFTLTDLIYIAAEDILKDKHVYITRYPMTNYMGTFPTKISIISTTDTVKIKYGDKIYNHYPLVEPGLDPMKVGMRFSEVVNVQNTYLASMGGDYDGRLLLSINPVKCGELLKA